MYIITGGAGFIGNAVVRSLNKRGVHEILVVDHLNHNLKVDNLIGTKIIDYEDRDSFLEVLLKNKLKGIKAIIHQGACSNTLESDNSYIMKYNFNYSKSLLNYALTNNIPLIYASSAAVYGKSKNFSVNSANEFPLNTYGYSKLLFDQYTRYYGFPSSTPIVGLRYFNVYGPGEAHKGKMASMVYQVAQKIKKDKSIELYRGTGDCADGEQKRDFIYVADIVKVILFFLEKPSSGIFNVGTGISNTFNTLARSLIDYSGISCNINYISMPDSLKDKYQNHTKADISDLQKAGYIDSFKSLNEGIKEYITTVKLFR